MREAFYCLVDDRASNDHQRSTIKHGSQHLKAFITIGLTIVGEPMTQGKGNQSDTQRNGIAQHVTSISQQGKALREQAPYNLYQHIEEDNSQGYGQGFFITSVAMTMAMSMVVRMFVSHNFI